jgi:hypothetical protein
MRNLFERIRNSILIINMVNQGRSYAFTMIVRNICTKAKDLFNFPAQIKPKIKKKKKKKKKKKNKKKNPVEFKKGLYQYNNKALC